jgi:hypothetical protein
MNHIPPPKPLPHRPALRTKAAPRATVPLSIGDMVTIQGQTYVVGVALIPQGSPSPPPPPPPPPPPLARITGYRNANRDPATQFHSGDLLIIEGDGLAAATRAMIGGVPATNLQPNATGISVTIPPLPVGMPPPATVEVDQGTQVLARGLPIVVYPPGVPLPLISGDLFMPRITWLVDATGARLLTVHPGQVVTIQGRAFGNGRGFVWVHHVPAAVQAWTDEALVIVVPSLQPGAGDLEIRRPDGIHTGAWVQVVR